MRFHVIVISFFLLSIGILLGGAKIVSIRSIANELLSDEYVRRNILPQTGEFEEDQDTYFFNNVKGSVPIEKLKTAYYKSPPNLFVLGLTSEPKKIVVDLEDQRVYAYEGDRLVFNFLVSTGKYGATPPGNYKIWYKVRSQTMKGGSKELGTYYYLPNVQFIQYFNKGIGFHSTYWHNNFGQPMSHGCVNMTLTDSETLYYWANPDMPNGVRVLRPTTSNPGTEVEVVRSWDI